MTLTLTRQMISAELLKLIRRRSTMLVALLLTVGPILVVDGFRGVESAVSPNLRIPVGGHEGFANAVELIGRFIGPVAAIYIGTEAGANDSASGVFRDSVATGRSRLALFLVRLPAALVVTVVIVTLGFLVGVVSTVVFAHGAQNPSGLPSPSLDLYLKGLGYVLLADCVICLIAVGVASMLNSRPASLAAMIGWQLAITPLLEGVASLHSAREVVLGESLLRFAPIIPTGDPQLTFNLGIAIAVLIAWVGLFLGLGAYRTMTMDA